MNKRFNSENILSRLLKWSTAAGITAMTVSGFGQMPIFKRYYIADIPGLKWTADYYITHNMHYIGAVVLLLLFSYFTVNFFLAQKNTIKITRSGLFIIFILSVLFISGILKVISSQRGIYFDGTTLISLDIIHTLFTFILLVSLAVLKIMKYKLYKINEDERI